MSKLDDVSEAIGALRKGQDILLGRTEKMITHLEKINGNIGDLEKDVILNKRDIYSNKTKIKELNNVHNLSKWSWKKTMAVIGVIATAVSVFLNVVGI